MNSKYPQNLIEETIRCFKEEDGIVLTEEDAIAALDGLGELFLAFSKTNASRTPHKQADGTAHF